MAESATPPDSVVIHVPHSSTCIPEYFLDQFISTSDRLEVIHEALVDYDTDKMAAVLERVITFPYSRLLVDVERFIDDSVEEMAEIGMGVFYSVDHELQQMRREITAQEHDALFELYVAHHQQLEEAVDDALETFNRCLLIDLHSYSAARLPYERSDGERPQLCIGTDEGHTPRDLINLVTEIAEEHGYQTAINTPFAGTLVPLKHYRHDTRVESVMLEWRKDLYRTNGITDEAALQSLRNVISEIARQWKMMRSCQRPE